MTPDCVPGRSGLLVTLLLVLITIYLHEQDTSPSVHGITPLIIWNQICLTMVIIALLEYAAILYLIRFRTPTKHGKRIGCFGLDMIRSKTLEKRETSVSNTATSMEEYRNSKADETEIYDPTNDPMDARLQMAKSIDRHSLILVPISFFIIVFVYWIHFSLKN